MTCAERQWSLTSSFAGQLALAVFGNRVGRVSLARGLLPAAAGPAAARLEMCTSRSTPAGLGVDCGNDIACADLVDFVEFGPAAGLGQPRRSE